jgi:hypothetical protein
VQIVRGRARGEQRTINISCMVMTLEVSQLRGWLKAVACCRGSKAGHTWCGAGCGPGGGRPRVSAAQRVQRGERAAADFRGRARGAAHAKHVVHVRDAGGVPAQGLVELVRHLPRVASRAHGTGRAAGREAGGGG